MLPIRVSTSREIRSYVRLFDAEELAAAEDAGELSFQDIVVLQEAPFDLASVVSGIVTATRQGPLSHLNVRSAARGTPNMYATDAFDYFAPFEGQRVCLDVGPDGYSAEAATLAEAEAFWMSIRPAPVEVVAPNESDETIMPLLDLATMTPAEREAAVALYGSKGTNLATLYQRIEEYDEFAGVLLPAAFYARFIDEGRWDVDLGDGEGSHTFRETLEVWNAAAVAPSAAQLRSLQQAMEEAPVPEDIVTRVHEAITTAYGTDRTEVRFRSSSNAEDAIGFSGAGLYESTSVCPADSVDDDDVGPSLCGERSGERTIERGLRHVWASLWNVRAVNERGWYGIDPGRVSMSILVNDRSGGEQSNVVAFSGNPIDGSTDLLLTAQIGEIDLVRPEPGVRPETLLVIESEGFAVRRLASSTETSGEVLGDETATAIARFLVDLRTSFPVDGTVPAGRALMLDTEWKVLADGRLVIKQVRPFVY